MIKNIFKGRIFIFKWMLKNGKAYYFVNLGITFILWGLIFMKLWIVIPIYLIYGTLANIYINKYHCGDQLRCGFEMIEYINKD